MAGVRVVAVRVPDVPAGLLPLPGQPEHHRPGVEVSCWVPLGVEVSSAVLGPSRCGGQQCWVPLGMEVSSAGSL